MKYSIAVAFVLVHAFSLLPGNPLAAQESTVWLGTTRSEGSESKGIYRATFDSDTGVLSSTELAAEVTSPGFVVLHPNGKLLYAVCQLPDGQGGGVAAYKISKDKKLTLLNAQPIGDGGAAHLAVDATGSCLFTAQYGGGSVAVFPLDGEGRISERTCLVKHEGSGPDQERQQGPHPHYVGIDPGNRFLLVPDLGIDKVMIYEMDLSGGQIKQHGFGKCVPGGGPRHLKFHPNGKFVFVLNELKMSVTVFKYDADQGTLSLIQTTSTLPKHMQEIPNKSSEIRIHPSGKFVYAANRGHDSIAAFRVDPSSGKLTFIEREAIRGSWPRNFSLDPSGKWLVAAGRNSNTLSVFELDQETGQLLFTGRVVNSPSTICVTFQP